MKPSKLMPAFGKLKPPKSGKKSKMMAALASTKKVDPIDR